MSAVLVVPVHLAKVTVPPDRFSVVMPLQPASERALRHIHHVTQRWLGWRTTIDIDLLSSAVSVRACVIGKGVGGGCSGGG